jgi:hypothetical protein
MNEKIIVEEKEKQEEDTYKSMRELSKYSKILSEQNNLSIIFKNSQPIKLRNSNSLLRISLLIGNLPEENVCFTFYANEDEEQSDDAEKGSKKSFVIVSNKSNIKISQKNDKEQSKDNDIDDDKNQKDSKSVYLIDKIKPVYAREIYNNGNIIGYDHSLFKSVWINLYRASLIISIISLIAAGFYSVISYKEKKYEILKANILSFICLILMTLISFSGNAKMSSKKKVEFNLENTLLPIFVLISIISLVYWTFLFRNKSVGLNINVFVGIDIIFGLLILISFCLIYLNIKMVDFYKRYYKMAEEGTLLREVE